MEIGSNGVTSTGTVKLDANSTLVLNGTLDAHSSVVDFSSAGILTADYGTSAGDNAVITFTDIDTGAKLNTVAYNAGTFQKYLDTFETKGLLRDVAFRVVADDVVLSITDNSGEAGADVIGEVLNSQGVGDMAEYAKPLADAWKGIATINISAPTAFTGVGKTTADLITKLAEGKFASTGDTRGAEAAVNFLTGMDMAKSIDAAGQTAHRAVGNVFNRIQQNNTLRTAANDAFGSGSAYANSVLNADYANRFWLVGRRQALQRQCRLRL